MCYRGNAVDCRERREARERHGALKVDEFVALPANAGSETFGADSSRPFRDKAWFWRRSRCIFFWHSKVTSEPARRDRADNAKTGSGRRALARPTGRLLAQLIFGPPFWQNPLEGFG